MTNSITVRQVSIMDSAEWSWRDGRPHWRGGVYDPFPAYPHDLAVVTSAVEYVQECCPPLWDVDLHVLDREEVARSNAATDTREGKQWDEAAGAWVPQPPHGDIMLSGKRIPPHPSVTRYAVGHEYGHQVQCMISHARGAKSVHDKAILTEYVALRGLPAESVAPGLGGTWHAAAAEVFACDFRVLAVGIDPQYWPHPGVPHPGTVEGLAGWWDQALADLTTFRTAQDAAEAEPIEAAV